MRDLTPKQKAFCLEYLVDFNATDAARRAGYAARSAEVTGPRLLGNVRVQAELARLGKQKANLVDASADRSIKEIAAAAYSDIGEIFDCSSPQLKLRPFNEIAEHARRAIASIKVRRVHGEQNVETIEFKFWDKIKALETLLKYFKLIEPEQVNHNLNVQVIAGVDIDVILGRKPGVPDERIQEFIAKSRNGTAQHINGNGK